MRPHGCKGNSSNETWRAQVRTHAATGIAGLKEPEISELRDETAFGKLVDSIEHDWYMWESENDR